MHAFESFAGDCFSWAEWLCSLPDWETTSTTWGRTPS